LLTKLKVLTWAKNVEFLSGPECMGAAAFGMTPLFGWSHAMVMVNYHGKIIRVNSQTEKPSGYHRDAVIGQTVDNLVPRQFRDRIPAIGPTSSRIGKCGRWDVAGIFTDCARMGASFR
jgi:hypothetical protein